MSFNCATLAAFAAEARNEAIPSEVWSAAERCLLDTLAAIVAGAGSKNASDTRAAALSIFGRGDFPVWFAECEPMHFLGVLLSNCASASSLDVDDGHRGSAGHAGAAIVPAVLMECARNPHSGRDALAAIIIGYDIALRVGASRLRHERISFASGIWTAYGVAAAIGRLRGLPAGVLAHAIAIAGAEAPGNLPQGACMASSVKGSSPWSTVTAFAAVERAAAGATGSIDLLDRDDAFDGSSMVAGLGSRWLITETYFKPYAACRYTHPVIDGILEIQALAGDDWNLQNLEGVEIDIFPEAARLPNSLQPSSLEDAQFSLPFAAALAVVGGGKAFRPMVPDSLSNPDALAIARRIIINYDAPEFVGAFPGRTPANIRIRMNGRQFASRVDHPFGDPANPMTKDDIACKLKEFGGQRADDLTAAVGFLQHEPTDRLLSHLAR